MTTLLLIIQAALQEKLQSRIRSLNTKIMQTVKGSPRTVNLDKVLGYLDELREFYKNVPRKSEYLDEIDVIEAAIKKDWGKKLPVETAQKMKQSIYRLHRKHYGEMKSLQIEVDKTIARGLKEELVKQHPELGMLNAEDSSLLSLESVLERSVNRIRNYDVIRLGDMIMTTTGGVVSGAPGAVTAGLVRRTLANPTVKSKLAFALWKARQAQGLPTAARLGSFYGAREMAERYAPPENALREATPSAVRNELTR